MRTHHREIRKNRARCSATIDIAIILLANGTRRGLVGKDGAIISELTGSERQRQGVNGGDGDEESKPDGADERDRDERKNVKIHHFDLENVVSLIVFREIICSFLTSMASWVLLVDRQR